MQTAAGRQSAARPVRKPRIKKSNPLAKIIPIGIAAVIIIIIAVVVSKNAIKPKVRQAHEYKERALTPQEQAMGALADAQYFEKDNPDKIDEIVALYQKIIDDYPGTRSARGAKSAIRRYEKLRLGEIDKCIAEITKKGDLLYLEGDMPAVIAFYKDYNGKFIDETADFRKGKIVELTAEMKKTEKEKNKSVFDKAVAMLFDNGATAAYLFMTKHADSAGDKQDEYLQLKELLDSAMGIDDVITKSLEAQIGKTIELELKSKKVKIHITSIKKGMIVHTKRIGRANITETIPIDDLSDRERAKRIGSDVNGLAVSMGLKALQSNMFENAKMYFGTIPSPLRETLTEVIEDRQIAYKVKIYTTQLHLALRMARVKSTSRDNLKNNLEMLKKTELSPGMRMLLHGAAKDVWRQSRKTKWIKEHNTVALIKYMLALKPNDEEWNPPLEEDDEDSTEADSAAADDSEPTDNKNQNDVDLNIDWRKEIDF
jgi:hypothetical protein